MTKYLSRLLNAAEPQFGHMIARLEDATLRTGIDVRFTAEIRGGVRQKIAALDLDPNDTTSEELLQALIAQVKQDNAVLSRVLKIDTAATAYDVTAQLQAYFSKQHHNPDIWSLKRTVLKKLLQKHVPHRAMKALKYRSAVSLLKRETPATIYATALLVENPTYKKILFGELKQLTASDFESRPVELVTYTKEQWASIKKYVKTQTLPVFSLPEAHAVVLLPVAPKRKDTYVLLVTALVLHELRRLKVEASRLKYRSMHPQLHEHLQNLAVHAVSEDLTIHGQQVHWHHLHRIFSRADGLPEYLGMHMSDVDLSWLAIEAQLSAIDERLSFWLDTQHLGFVSQEAVVSLHLIDVALHAVFPAPLQSRTFLQETVRDELWVRYLEAPPFTHMIDRHMNKMSDIQEEILYD